MNKKTWLGTLTLNLSALVMLAGCATAPESVNVADANASCQRETPVGTNFPKVTCRSAEDLERQRRDAEAMRAKIFPQPVLPGEGTGPR